MIQWQVGCFKKEKKITE